MCIFLNKYLRDRKLVTEWKMANREIITACVENYRPISLTYLSYKIIELAIYSNLIAHLNVKSFLIQGEHVFRSGASSSTVLDDVFSFSCWRQGYW